MKSVGDRRKGRAEAGGQGMATKPMDEKKPADLSGLNPYQEETWRRQESLYTTAYRGAITF
jgi:hypothetical protein